MARFAKKWFRWFRRNLDGGETPLLEREPDVEARFVFNGTRVHPAADGYRPCHLVRASYLTTGVHHYYGGGPVPPDGSAMGTITFLTPRAYPHCLWVGKTIPIQEGARVVGYAEITKVFNPLLRAEGEGAPPDGEGGPASPR